MSTKRLLAILEDQLGPLTFGMFLRGARTALGLTQVDMAKKLRIARGTLCDIEKGRQTVSPELALRVAKKAGLSPEIALQACLQDQVNRVKFKLRVDLVAA